MVQDTLGGVTTPPPSPFGFSDGSPAHHCQLGRTPWSGVHSTRIHSARHFGRHWHATLGIGWLEDGAQHSASGRGPVEARAGDLISSNPGEVHDGRPLGGGARRWQMLYFEPEAAADWLQPRRTGSNDLARPVFQDPPLRMTLQRLFAALATWRTSPADTATLACEEALTAVVAGLARHQAFRRADTAADRLCPSDRAALRTVRERLADDLTRAPTLAELAALAGCSRFQLLRRFQQAHGLPPHAWLLQQRLEHARQLIGRGSGLAQAAAASGFSDQSHLTRHFSRQFGYTPGAWRAAVGAQAR
jgi:AraC-like DNA-binding protein